MAEIDKQKEWVSFWKTAFLQLLVFCSVYSDMFFKCMQNLIVMS